MGDPSEKTDPNQSGGKGDFEAELSAQELKRLRKQLDEVMASGLSPQMLEKMSKFMDEFVRAGLDRAQDECDSPEISLNDWVEQVVKSKKLKRPFAGAALLWGYLQPGEEFESEQGSAPARRFYRLYTSALLNEYVDINCEDVLFTMDLAENGPAYSGSLVWVNPDADVQYARTEPAQVRASFLQGGIVGLASPGITPGVSGVPTGGGLSQPCGGGALTIYCGGGLSQLCGGGGLTVYCGGGLSQLCGGGALTVYCGGGLSQLCGGGALSVYCR